MALPGGLINISNNPFWDTQNIKFDTSLSLNERDNTTDEQFKKKISNILADSFLHWRLCHRQPNGIRHSNGQ